MEDPHLIKVFYIESVFLFKEGFRFPLYTETRIANCSNIAGGTEGTIAIYATLFFLLEKSRILAEGGFFRGGKKY